MQGCLRSQGRALREPLTQTRSKYDSGSLPATLGTDERLEANGEGT